ncbi:MAG: CvpA family protein [Candidatus Dormibacteria bacterium]
MLAAIDNTSTQLGADGLLVVLVVVNAAIGWRTGTLRRLIAFAGLYAGIIAAYYTAPSIASWFDRSSVVASAWTFIAVTALLVLIAEIIGHVLADRVSRLLTLVFDRGAGVLVGAGVGFFQALTLFWVALALAATPPGAQQNVPADHAVYANAVQSSVLAGQAVRALPALQTIVRPALGSDVTGHLLTGSASS